MPDIFVPRDTTLYTSFYYNVRALGLVYQFALKYADENRNTLNKYKDADSLLKYLNGEPILQKFVSFAKSKKVKIDQKQLNISKPLIDIELKAYIARNTIDNKGFYPIIHKIDNVLQRAVEEMDKDFPF